MTTRRPPTANFARTITWIALAALVAVVATSADAALVARDLDGNNSTVEAYYDTTLGITWLRDTSALSAVTGLSSAMSYADATNALATFNASAAMNHGYANWRLPTAEGVHLIGGAGCQFGFNGSTDCGDNVVTASGELASMFYDTLGNLGWRDTSGNFRAGIQGTDWGLVNLAGFDNLDTIGYWSSTASFRLVFGMPQNGQVVFDMRTGGQGISAPSALKGAWIVHDGDIGSAVSAAPVPLPGTLALAALGLALLPRRRGH